MAKCKVICSPFQIKLLYQIKFCFLGKLSGKKVYLYLEIVSNIGLIQICKSKLKSLLDIKRIKLDQNL